MFLLSKTYMRCISHCLSLSILFVSPFALSETENILSQTNQNITSEALILSVNEPMYFIVGGSDDTKARFQFSFKYRIFDNESNFINKQSWLKGLHFSYTQTSLWNLSKNSAPFEDSSYKPSFFWDNETHQKNFLPQFIRTGFEHESNGQTDEKSRSINTLYFWPFWRGKRQGNDWLIGPKFYYYLTKDEFNDDIEKYRGYVDLWLRYGKEDSWLISSILRHGESDHSMIQLELSYPVRNQILARTGGYLYLQIFQGYGETMLTYNQKQDAQIRIGFSIVR